MPETTSRNDGLTIACPVCGGAFRQVGRRRYCSDTCRQAAWRQRHPAPGFLQDLGDLFAVLGAHEKFTRRNPRDVQQFKHLWWSDSV